MMQKPLLLLAGAVLLALSLDAGAAKPCRYSAPRNAELDAAGLQRLSVEIGPDVIDIQGQPGLTKVLVRGTACASSEQWLQDIKVDTARQGDTASIIAQDGHHVAVFSLFGGSYAYLKLDVRVPPSLAVKLGVGSGEANASHLAALDASVGSGDLKAKGIVGELGLSVGSGDAVAGDVGSLKLASVGSGDVTVDGVHGDAHAGSVGSGDLGLRNVQGNVSVESVASGDAKVAQVGGAVTVGRVGSGSFDASGVKGDVSVRTVSSGDVRIAQAGGSVRADSLGSGSFEVNGVAGDFSVGAVASGDIHHRGVKGKVSVPRAAD